MSQAYWDKRLEALAEKAFKQGDKSISELRKIFMIADKEVNEQISMFYGKYGVIQESPTFKTLADGTKVVSGTSKKLVVPKMVADVRLKEGTRLTKLNKQLDGILMQLSKDQNAYMKATLGNIATNGYYDNIYEIYKGYGVGTSFNLLDPKIVNQLIKNPVNGQDFSERVWNNRSKLANVVNQTLNNGITQGLSNKVMAQELAKNMNSGFNVAKTLINTEVTNAYSQASKLGYEESKLVKQYIYMATLDSRTSDVCTELDGQVFDLDKATTGLNFPPMHTNCRSTTSAYFDDSRAFQTRMARDVETGKNFYVPGDMTAKDFKSIYVTKDITRKEWDRR